MRVELNYKAKATQQTELTIILEGEKSIVLEILETIDKVMEKYEWLELA